MKYKPLSTSMLTLSLTSWSPLYTETILDKWVRVEAGVESQTLDYGPLDDWASPKQETRKESSDGGEVRPSTSVDK